MGATRPQTDAAGKLAEGVRSMQRTACHQDPLRGPVGGTPTMTRPLACARRPHHCRILQNLPILCPSTRGSKPEIAASALWTMRRRRCQWARRPTEGQPEHRAHSSVMRPTSTSTAIGGSRIARRRARRSQRMCMKKLTISPAFNSMNRRMRNHHDRQSQESQSA